MSTPGLIANGGLSLGPTRLEGRLLAPHHLPACAARCRAGDNGNLVAERAIEAAHDLSGHGRHRAIGSIGATGGLATTDQIKLDRAGQRQVGCMTQ